MLRLSDNGILSHQSELQSTRFYLQMHFKIAVLEWNISSYVKKPSALIKAKTRKQIETETLRSFLL